MVVVVVVVFDLVVSEWVRSSEDSSLNMKSSLVTFSVIGNKWEKKRLR